MDIWINLCIECFKSFIFQLATPDLEDHCDCCMFSINSDEWYCHHPHRVSAVVRIMHSWPPEMSRLFLRGDSFASGPVNVRKDHTVLQGSALSWMAVAAARVVPVRLESRATREISVIPTKACTVISQLTSQDMRLECVHVSSSHLFFKFLWKKST